jgi:cell division control protein 12
MKTNYLLATQNCRQAWSPFYHDGRRFVTGLITSLSIHFSYPVNQGESGLGKTTLINTLFSTELSATKNYNRRHHKQLDKLTEVEIIKAELEEKQFKVKLTVIDTPGFGDYVNNRDSWSPIVDFIDDQHEAYMIQEQQPQRSEKSDLRVHACLYFIRPTGHTYVFNYSSLGLI